MAFLDLDTMEIDDGCSAAIVLMLAVSVITMPGLSIVSRLIGAAAVSVPMLILTLLIPGAFGGGDIRLMASSGLFLGWKADAGIHGCRRAVPNLRHLPAGSQKEERKDHFAFGPFLAN